VLDEFAPFGYRNFAQILQTARGTHTAFLFSMQSLPQLMVGHTFDVWCSFIASAFDPGT
jgi:type IV secretory pathway TraG/TraD family ATPase VirD4